MKIPVQYYDVGLGGRGRRRRNRRRRSVLISLCLLMGLVLIAAVALSPFSAGAGPVASEVQPLAVSAIDTPAVVDMPRDEVGWMVSGTSPAELGQTSSSAPSTVTEPVADLFQPSEPSSAGQIPKPVLLTLPEPKATVSAGLYTEMQLTPEVKSALKTAAHSQSRQSAEKAEVVTVSRVTVSDREERKAKPAQTAKPAPIPSFENTAGDTDDGATGVAGAHTEEAPVWKTLLSVIFKLIFVVALAYVSILALKWFMSNKDRPISKGGGVRLVESVSLGANRSLHVVECSGKRLILASTPNQVNLITETDAASDSEPAPQGFDSYLQSSLAGQSQQDSAAMKVGQALREGAAFLLKKANLSGSSQVAKDHEQTV